jgi:hypothetical protein
MVWVGPLHKPLVGQLVQRSWSLELIRTGLQMVMVDDGLMLDLGQWVVGQQKQSWFGNDFLGSA